MSGLHGAPTGRTVDEERQVDPYAATGLLGLRLALGVVFLLHGLRKLGWGGGTGHGGFAASIARRGFRPARLWVGMALAAEVPGALSVILGLAAPVGAALLVAQGVTITWLSRPKGFWHDRGGTEYPLVLTAAALLLACTGPGPLALDALLGLDAWWGLGPALAGLAALGAAAGLALRRPPAEPAG